MFYQQFISLCNRDGIKPTPLVKSLGLSPGNIKRWENGATINSDILLKLSEHFKVSTDYLLTGKERNTDLTEREELLIKWYRECNQEGKDHIMQTADMVKDKYKKADTISCMENIVG